MTHSDDRTIPWRVVARRAGRNDLPAILITYWERLSPADKVMALEQTWTMVEYPAAHAEPAVWLNLFDDVGYIVDGKVADRDNDPSLPEIVTLWRGSAPSRRNGMSWSLDRAQAEWFANRWVETSDERGVLYRIQIPREYVLARFATRSENEVVVDTTDFDDDEYEVIDH